MYRRLGDRDDKDASPDGSILLAFLVVVAASAGALLWTGDTRERGAGPGVRVYQHPGSIAELSENSPAIDKITTSVTPRPVEGAAPAASAPVQCNIDACAAAYRSFRVADCTFQPYDGPRRLCTR